MRRFTDMSFMQWILQEDALPKRKSEYIDLAKRAVNDGRAGIDIEQVWSRHRLALTYWALLVSGINDKTELEIAKTVLVWQAFVAGHLARLLCLPSAPYGDFIAVRSAFEVDKQPTLILSNSVSMEKYVIIPEKVLRELHKNNKLQEFLDGAHNNIRSGKSLDSIQEILDRAEVKEWANKGVKVLERISKLIKIGGDSSSKK
jgi:hypothetical protein